ncbi:MAG TPA: SRPBCC family protein [Gemmatimonadaceae bacterium]|nr:SRPBCC family protein [Gemmatimonadaceae bacterium]
MTSRAPEPENASPLGRLAAVAGSAALLSWRARDERATGLARALGAACLALASWPLLEASVRLNGDRKRRLDVRSSVEIARPVADVFDFFKDLENLPHAVRAVTAVHDSQDGRSHWIVRSERGVALEWDAVTTKYVPRSVIAFESVPGGPVEVSITLRFVPLAPDRTRLAVDVTYRALQTELSDAIRALLSRRPARRMHMALEHTRTYIESLSPTSASGALPSPQPVE